MKPIEELDHMTYDDLLEEADTDTLHKVQTAYAKGYFPRKREPAIENYKGRYGEGYKVHLPAYNTSRYHIVEYWVY